MSCDKIGFSNCYKASDRQAILRRDYDVYKKRRDKDNVNYTRWTIEILEDEFCDYSLSHEKVAVSIHATDLQLPSWDRQLADLMSSNTPVYLK